MIVVETPGLLSTVQDQGRWGMQHGGLAPAGAMDDLALLRANLLVGNASQAAALEITLKGPHLRLEADLVVALCGAPFPLKVEGQSLPLNTPLALKAGTLLKVGTTPTGLRGVLAVAGGIAVPPVLGSRSTLLTAALGGVEGRALRAGDRLATGPSRAYANLHRQLNEGTALAVGPTDLPWLPEREGPLGVVPGPELEALLDSPFDRDWLVGPASNRMGLRLQGPPLRLKQPLEMLSAGVATGTLQLPPDGQPILLLADRQTTGGYPRLGELASVDLTRAAQLRPGQALRLGPISLEAAQQAWMDRCHHLDRLTEHYQASSERG